MSESPPLDLPIPPGYGSLQPLDRERHRGLAVDPAARGRLARRANAIFITAPEFFQVARHFPIAFTRAGEGGPLLCVAVTSFTEGSNRFVDEGGAWLPGVYVPAYVRRYPFHSVAVRRDEASPEPDFLICVDETGLIESDAPLFTDTGEPTASWTEMEALIRNMEAARRQTQRLLGTIGELDLLEPFEAHGTRAGGRTLRLRNMLRVDEEKLNALPGATVKALMDVGALSRIYAHLMSLDNFAFLLDRELAAS